MSITPKQIRVARRLLGWSQLDLVLAAQVTPSEIRCAETGQWVADRVLGKVGENRRWAVRSVERGNEARQAREGQGRP